MGSLKLNSHFTPEATSWISKGKESSHPSINFEWRNWLSNFTESVSLSYQVTPTWNAKNLDANHLSCGCNGSMSERIRFLSHGMGPHTKGKNSDECLEFPRPDWLLNLNLAVFEYNSMCSFLWTPYYIACIVASKYLSAHNFAFCPG